MHGENLKLVQCNICWV